ncbi:ribbon-helix-helix domain-containing protein [Bradyrhizobium sp. CCGUVB1N3]|uniref:ribbon-helix-helix domain-containing protein n=1 Tax=Bradyrhizobium sp. CCGUVB1N3 TaxID=2949629 RepID=UPI0020B3C804|nr:ribbon-helix-helix domain-containing protein [Bradyrhizobium sp. CCGUVB1N3]MCP3471701.1 ribbon-helix-helix domain-containing protein [Bradyrhizobium sp. CCGUVB1N3]
MCNLFARQPQRNYETQTRSLRIGGHCTSIRLELAFWDTLEEIAAKERMSLAKFLTTLHNEVLEHYGEVNNFTSLLRCCCLIYRSSGDSTKSDFVTPISVLRSSEPESRLSALERKRHEEAALALFK